MVLETLSDGRNHGLSGATLLMLLVWASYLMFNAPKNQKCGSAPTMKSFRTTLRQLLGIKQNSEDRAFSVIKKDGWYSWEATVEIKNVGCLPPLPRSRMPDAATLIYDTIFHETSPWQRVHATSSFSFMSTRSRIQFRNHIQDHSSRLYLILRVKGLICVKCRLKTDWLQANNSYRAPSLLALLKAWTDA